MCCILYEKLQPPRPKHSVTDDHVRLLCKSYTGLHFRNTQIVGQWREYVVHDSNAYRCEKYDEAKYQHEVLWTFAGVMTRRHAALLSTILVTVGVSSRSAVCSRSIWTTMLTTGGLL